jgi:WD40 repeat protein
MFLGNCVVVRDLATGGTLATLRLDSPGFDDSSGSHVGFLSDESVLVTARHGQLGGNGVINSVMRWNWTTNKISARRLFPTPTSQLLPVAASKDGRRVALAERGFVTVWDGSLGHEIGRFPTRNPNGNLLMSLSSDGTRLALAATDQTSVLIWDTATSQLLLTLTDDNAPQFLMFTASRQLIAVNPTGGLTIWETQRPKWLSVSRPPAPAK